MPPRVQAGASACLPASLPLLLRRLGRGVPSPAATSPTGPAASKSHEDAEVGEEYGYRQSLVAPELPPGLPGALRRQDHELQVAPRAQLDHVGGLADAPKLPEQPADRLRPFRKGGGRDNLEDVTRLHPAPSWPSPSRTGVGDSLAHGRLVAELRVANDRHAGGHGLRRRVAAAVGDEGDDLRVRQGPHGWDPVMHQDALWQRGRKASLLHLREGPEHAVAVRIQGVDHGRHPLGGEVENRAEAHIDHRHALGRRVQEGLDLRREGLHPGNINHGPRVLHQGREGLRVVEAWNGVDYHQAAPPSRRVYVRHEGEAEPQNGSRMLEDMQ
mmetsp:Transcript_35707/g.110872  ORF Transcript_35707/g.110872 Transcript_35707/m.110872 type:complete len:328 (+) Transcript_35707:3-986(+)